MAFDYKKKYKEFYLPPKVPGIVTVPAMNFLAVRGQGDPNEEDGAYKLGDAIRRGFHHQNEQAAQAGGLL